MALSLGTESEEVRGHRSRDSSENRKISTYADTATITMSFVSPPYVEFTIPSHSLAFFGPSLSQKIPSHKIVSFSAGN